MPDFSFVLLYVKSPGASAAFYADLLGMSVIEQSSTFAMLPLREGVMLGLWSRETVEPQAVAASGASEVAFTVADVKAAREIHADWAKRGLKIAQELTHMHFGTTFVALDPDGHRLRVFAPRAA